MGGGGLLGLFGSLEGTVSPDWRKTMRETEEVTLGGKGWGRERDGGRRRRGGGGALRVCENETRVGGIGPYEWEGGGE